MAGNGPGRKRLIEKATTPSTMLAAFLRKQVEERLGGDTWKFAERLGCNRSTADRYLSGKLNVPFDRLEDLAKALRYSSHKTMLAAYAKSR